jgi:hypothetical protein
MNILSLAQESRAGVAGERVANRQAPGPDCASLGPDRWTQAEYNRVYAAL